MVSRLLHLLYTNASPSPQPERALLLLGCRRQLSADQQRHLRDLIRTTPGFDWPALVTMAVDQRVFPLVYWNLQAHAADLVPARQLAALQEAFVLNTFSSVRMRDELVRAVTTLRSHGIGALALRGPMVAQSLYGKTWLREFKDIDILVRPRDFDRAKAICFALGYIRPDPVGDNDFNQALVNPATQIKIELHWAVDSPFMRVDVNTEAYWSRAVEVDFDGQRVQTLSPDDLLLMLCFHGAKHRWHRLKWVYDIAEFVYHHPDLDWAQTLKTARQLRVERILLVCLALAHNLFQTPLPPVIAARLDGDWLITRLTWYIQRWIFDQAEPRVLDQIRGIGFFLLIREHLRDWLPSIWHALHYPKSPLLRRVIHRGEP
ncbi:MAG: nucleotidyltransferase family protein [Chloroflexi bacterium]|nr:nucleotidyltransferase family protein [Chloroflexota bacterium]